MIDHHDATPSEGMEAVDLDKSYHEQVEHYCAITRYSIFREQNGTKGFRAINVE